MDELAQNLLATLKKSSTPVEAKVSQFNTLKSNIKHQRIPESAQATTVECVRFAIAAQTSSTLVTTGFSTLGHLIKRLSLQDQTGVFFTSKSQVIPALLDKLGDPKEGLRTAASQSLRDLWPFKQEAVEKVIREGAISGNNARAKEAGMQWVTKMHEEHGLQFRGFVPPLVECLDHADGNVRESAKSNIIELFRGSNDRAKADLKRQLIAHNVRKSIAHHILTQLHIPIPAELGSSSTHHPNTGRETPAQDIGVTDAATNGGSTLPPSAEVSNIEPLYIDSQRELEDMFRTMQPFFEGREDESNWKARDNSILKLRRLLQGNTPTEHQSSFLFGIKNMLDGILKVPNSLRTTMSTNGCQFFQELARTFGPGIDPMVEILLQNFVKTCSATKNIASQNGNATVDVLFKHVSYNVRLIQHIWHACQDKNVQPRIYASGWIKSVMGKQLQNKAHFEHTGGLELAEKIVRKGLSDANPKVRECMRSAFWLLAQGWPSKSDSIFSDLDTKSKQLLEKDPSNPSAPSTNFTSSVGTSSSSNPRAAPSSSRSNLKETIAAQKKATMTAKRLPDRPNSAMATLSPVKHNVANRHGPTPSASSSRGGPPQSAKRPQPTPGASTNTGHGSLMSGPVRRPRKPEVPRPATADPYASSKGSRDSPNNSPIRQASKASVPSKANVTANRGRNAHVDSGHSSRTGTPRTSPAKIRPKTVHIADTSSIPSPQEGDKSDVFGPSQDENLTMVMPGASRLGRSPMGQSRTGEENVRPGSGHSTSGSMEDENFTMIMPQAPMGFVKATNTTRSPEKAKSGGENGTNVTSQKEQRDNDMVVYEDSSAAHGDQPVSSGTPNDVLEELPVNEQYLNLPNHNNTHGPVAREPVSVNDDESHSPSKAKSTVPGSAPGQVRAEVLKNRRILSSGVDRLHSKSLDALGFRRLQELVKSTSKDPEVHLSGLMRALLEYLEAPNDALKVNATKAQSLKSQALTTIRAVAALHSRDNDVRQLFAQTLCSVLTAKKMTEGISYMAIDLEKTADEVAKQAGDQTWSCVDRLAELGEVEQDGDDTAGHRKMTTMLLSILTKLLANARARHDDMHALHRSRLGKLAVKFLDDGDADVRRADTELCVELHDTFESADKAGFWGLLEGAREPQLNLVAYYLARRARAG